MKQLTKKLSPKIIFTYLLITTFFTIGINITTGSIHIPLGETISLILSKDTVSSHGFILWNIRIPRAVASAMGGAYLAVAGLLLQIFFRNPIVGPFILGISSGATLLVSLVMLTSISLGFTYIAPYLTTISALSGAYFTMIIVLIIATRVKDPITLLIVGLMMGYLCHSIVSILMAFAEQEKIKGFVLWQLGSFSGFKWNEIKILFFGGGTILLATFLLSKPLNGLLLGESYASSLGINIKVVRFFIILFSCALSGLVTAGAGPVAFIGLAIPHMSRLIFSTSDSRILIPASALLGASITSICDLISRMAFSPVEIPISAITAFFGAPVVILLLTRRKMAI